MPEIGEPFKKFIYHDFCRCTDLDLIFGTISIPLLSSKMNAVRHMMNWFQDGGSLGNLLQCQSLDVPQTLVGYGCMQGGNIYSCNEYKACLCKRCSAHWEKYIKLTLECPHKGTGTLATCEHYPSVPRSTPRDYPPPRTQNQPIDSHVKAQVLANKARQAVSKQELNIRTVIKDQSTVTNREVEVPVKPRKYTTTVNNDDFDNEKREGKTGRTKYKPSTIHTVPLPPDPLAQDVSPKHKDVDSTHVEERKLERQQTPKTAQKVNSAAKRRMRESLQLHRRSHDIHEGRLRKKFGREISKDRRVIKKRLKDSDHYVLEQGKIITRKGSFCNSFTALPTGPLFEDLEMPISKDDDIFEKIVSEERRAEFLGSTDDLWNLGAQTGGDSDTGIMALRNESLLEEDLSLQLKTEMPSSWESKKKEDPDFVAIGTNNLNYASSDSCKVKTSNLSVSSKESLSLKKQHRSSASKSGRSPSVSKSKDQRKRRVKRSKFTTTSESEELMAENSTDMENEGISIMSSVMMDGRKKKRNKGKKTPMEFEKRLIAGTKRYYQTKLEKLKSTSNKNMGSVERSISATEEASEDRAALRRSPHLSSGREDTSPASLVSLPPKTCSSPGVQQRGESQTPNSMQAGSSKHSSPLLGINESKIPSPILEQCKRSRGASTGSHATNMQQNSEDTSSRPPSCVISVSRLKNVRVGPSIKERFCNSLVFAEKVNKPERSRFVNLTDGQSSASIHDGFSAQLKASKIKLHRELALEEHLAPKLTPAWTFSYMSPAAPSYSDYINNVDIHI